MRSLGSGGMARVYEVRHSVLDTAHALKVLHLGTPGHRDRLVREGRVQAHLDPAYVVPVTDVLWVHGAPALVMPLVDGCALSELLRVHPPTEDEAATLIGQIARGVASAHRAGVVHRDLKPANVLLELGTGSVRARVADFGVAKALAQLDPTEEEDQPVGGRSSTAGFVGTHAYAAPEQRDGAEVGPAADLWSLGVILVELLTGERPGEAPADGVPPRWRDVVRGLLQPDPSRRLPSVEALLAAVPSGPPLSVGGGLAEAVRARRDQARAEVEPAPAGLPSTLHEAPSGPPRHNLAREPDLFVGRREELVALDRHLTRPGVVTLTGIGGAGKSRLALQAARGLAERGQEVWHVDLADARSAHELGRRVARALGVPLYGGDPVDRIAQVVAGRGRSVWVLDGFEDLPQDALAALGGWLERGPGLTLLVTSRRATGLPGEVVVAVTPLDAADAARLFVDRSTRAGYTPGPSDAGPIRELVERLDALPLAVELAAARAPVLPPGALLERMEERFRLLTPPSRTSGAQRSTLRAVLDWSWSQATAVEQVALARLTVFDGPFDLAAAEAVAALDPREPWLLDVLQSLAARSLVRVVGGGRFALLHCVRDYAREHLVDGAEAEARHGRWFAASGERDAVEALCRHGGQHRWRALASDLPNVLAACRRAVARRDGAVAARAAIAAWRVLLYTGPIPLGAELLEAVAPLEVPAALAVEVWAGASLARSLSGSHALAEAHARRALEVAEPLGPRERAVAASQWAVVLLRQNRADEAAVELDRAIDAAVEAGDDRLAATARRTLSTVFGRRGDTARAVELCEAALAVHLHLGDERAAAVAHSYLGITHLYAFDEGKASRHLEAALAAFRVVGDRRHEGVSLGDLSELRWAQGRVDEAVALSEAALAIHREVGERQHAVQELVTLGAIETTVGRLTAARSRLEAALAGGPPADLEARARSALGTIAFLRGALDDAERDHRAALDIVRRLGDPRLEAAVRVCLARVAAARGDRDAAGAELEQALTHARKAERVVVEAEALTLGGELRLADGDLVGARADLAAALDLLARGGDLFALGVARCVAARLERACGDLRAAVRLETHARDAAQVLGVGPDAPLARAVAHLSRR
ncbi:MAG: protein kinase [Myxococcota bacterium]